MSHANRPKPSHPRPSTGCCGEPSPDFAAHVNLKSMRRFPRPHRDEGRGLPPHRGGGKIDGEGTPNYNRREGSADCRNLSSKKSQLAQKARRRARNQPASPHFNWSQNGRPASSFQKMQQTLVFSLLPAVCPFDAFFRRAGQLDEHHPARAWRPQHHVWTLNRGDDLGREHHPLVIEIHEHAPVPGRLQQAAPTSRGLW